MRKTNHRRPEVEGLETMTLLSGMAGTVQPAIVALAAKTSLPNPLELSGTVHGTFKPKGVTGGTVNATGNVSPVGKVMLTSKVVTPTASGTPESLTVSTSKGKATVSAHIAPTGTGTFSGTYTITGGTKAFAGETGSGSIVVTVTLTKFTATFSPTPTSA